MLLMYNVKGVKLNRHYTWEEGVFVCKYVCGIKSQFERISVFIQPLETD